MGVVNIQYAANSQYNMGGTRRGVELREREREGERERKSERVQAYRRYFHRLHTARSIGDGTGNVVTENLHSSR